MFEDRIAALNQANTEKMAMGAMQYDKRTYTVDEIQDILGISRTSAYNLVKRIISAVYALVGQFAFPKRVLMNG